MNVDEVYFTLFILYFRMQAGQSGLLNKRTLLETISGVYLYVFLGTYITMKQIYQKNMVLI